MDLPDPDPRSPARPPRRDLHPGPAAGPLLADPSGPRTGLALRHGRLVVAKQREGPDARYRTETEARWLAAARHTGVVALRLVQPEHGRLETDHAGLATLRTVRPGPDTAARILARVAATVATLHRHGMVHGNLQPEHVVLSGPHRDRPRLCSPRVTAANQWTDPPELDRSLDVVALGRLVHLAANGDHTTGGPSGPGRRARARWLALAEALTDPGALTAAQAATRLDQLR